MEENPEVRKRIARESYWAWMKKYLQNKLNLQNERNFTGEELFEKYLKNQNRRKKP